jgi:hypothetical protein
VCAARVNANHPSGALCEQNMKEGEHAVPQQNYYYKRRRPDEQRARGRGVPPLCHVQSVGVRDSLKVDYTH